MLIKRSIQERLFEGINSIIMVFLIIITLYPLLYIIFASLSEPSKLIQHNGVLLGSLGFDLEAYRQVLKNPAILRGYLNTLFVVITGTSLNLVLTSLGAYALSRKDYYGKKLFMFIIIFTMFFNGGLIPFYLLVKGLGLSNSLWALIFPVAVFSWNLIIMRTSFASIPSSLEESAKIDGANDFTILFHIVLPLSMPIVAVMILYYGVEHWNSWFNAIIFLRNRDLYPIQLILREILVLNDTHMMTTKVFMDKESVGETIKYATVIVATLPILAVYPFLQKYFVKGIMIGALK